MEETKISDGVRDVLEFMKPGDCTMAEKMVILRSAADLLSQIILSEAQSANLIAIYQNFRDKK